MLLSKKVGILYVYFGKWPWFFHFFLKSCSYNLNITFIIITDLQPPKDYPENVKFIFKTFSEIKAIASQKLGFEVSLSSPYKLCDYKPLYGFLFDEILKEYDFWGHGDIDLIFGRIDHFINDKILNRYEVISVRHDYPTGFFMLFKNNKKINELFKKSKDYVSIFSSNKHFSFGECNFQHLLLMKGIDIFDTNASIESMMHVIKKEENSNLIKPYFNLHVIEGIPKGVIIWNKGKLNYAHNSLNIKVLLYHFIALKKNRYYKIPKWQNIPDIFFIDSLGFFKYSKKSLLGFLSRKRNSLRITIKKKFIRTSLKLNNFFLVLPLKNQGANVIQGTYFSSHRLVHLNFTDKEYQIKQILPFPSKQKIVLSPIFFSKNLFVDYNTMTRYRVREKKIHIIHFSGQEVVLKKKKEMVLKKTIS